MAHYTASKHGVVGLTRALGRELGPLGIRVLALAATLVETQGVAERRVDDGDSTLDAMAASRIPLGRVGQPDDVARVALFCASDLALYLTGTTIPVDGGALSTLF